MSEPQPISYRDLNTPIGRVRVVWSGAGLKAVEVGDQRQRHAPADWTHDPGLNCAATHQLMEYFAGQRRRFDIPLDMGGTPFQRVVWQALTTVPFGETVSYGQLAARIGRPTASRAVGAANGQNSIAIVVPCHRVIGASGKLTGYAGGLDIKLQLLELESKKLHLSL